jgi:heat-inducible transcriptional repressor
MQIHKLNAKENAVLEAVVNCFINSGDTIGSKSLKEKYNLPWSTATIRNIMCKLMDYGLLSQPHISAGRVPTETGMRYFISSLLNLRGLSEEKIDYINQRYNKTDLTLDELLVETSSVLSDISSFAGLATLPSIKYQKIKSSKLIKLDYKKILLIIIFKNGLTDKTLITLNQDISDDVLNEISLYLNKISEDLTLDDLKTTVLNELHFKKDEISNKIINSILKLSYEGIKQKDNEELFIKGRISLFEKIDLHDPNDLRELVKALEEKNYLIEILNKVKNGDGLRVFIGSDQGIMNGYSIVACSYGNNDNLGTLGVFGPLRMDYSQIIPLVDYTARKLSNIVRDGGIYGS